MSRPALNWCQRHAVLEESGLTYTLLPSLEFGASDAQDHGCACLHVLGGVPRMGGSPERNKEGVLQDTPAPQVPVHNFFPSVRCFEI